MSPLPQDCLGRSAQYVWFAEAPDDGHGGAQNMLSKQ